MLANHTEPQIEAPPGLEVLSQHPDHAAREAREPAGMHDVQAELHLDMEEGGLGMPGLVLWAGTISI